MGTAAVGVLMICVGTFLVCRALKIRPTLPMLLVVAALFATGLASMSSVPIAAQLADAKEDLDHWTDEQTEVVSRHHGQIATQNASLGAAMGQGCSCISPAATE